MPFNDYYVFNDCINLKDNCNRVIKFNLTIQKLINYYKFDYQK